jgi:hypothetical protein
MKILAFPRRSAPKILNPLSRQILNPPSRSAPAPPGRHAGPDQRGAPARAARRWLAACCAVAGSVAVAVAPAGQAEAAPTAWSTTPTPQTSRGSDQLYDVSCRGPAFCLAAGSGYYRARTGTVPGPVAEVWNGHRWAVTRTRIPGGDPDEFLGVSCVSSSFCVAVGRHFGGHAEPGDRALVETWNGRAWSVAPSPRPGLDSVLSAVSCTSSRSCQAVGYFDSHSTPGLATLVESWNGKAWSRAPSPSPGDNGVLQGVSCVRATRCMAVGSRDDASGAVTLAESWNGRRWSVTPSANRPVADELDAVSCVSAADCEAVGDFSPAQLAPPRTLAESWNGHRWSVVSSADRGSQGSVLAGVSCPGPADCVAVGYDYYTASGNARALVESLGASGWSTTPSPSPSADAQLHGVACTGAARCEAVGYHGSGSLLSDKTLVEAGS